MNQIIDLTINNVKLSTGIFELSVVIPVYNESTNIEKVLNDWDTEFKKLKINYCFIIVNDGSKDNSLDILTITFTLITLNEK